MVWIQGVRAIVWAGLAFVAGSGVGSEGAAQEGKQLDSPVAGEGTDRAALSSPLPAVVKSASIKVGTGISVMVSQAVDSAAQKNGDAVAGRLAAPVRTSTGQILPRGTKVLGTVVSAAKAGTIGSAGVLSLQLTHVGGVPVVTDVLDFNGQEGHKDLPDSAPEKGTEAQVRARTTLDFKVLDVGNVPGLVRGVAPANDAGGEGAPGAVAGTPAGTGSSTSSHNTGVTGVVPAGTSAPR